MKKIMQNPNALILSFFHCFILSSLLTGCIEPPLRLPEQDPTIITEIEVSTSFIEEAWTLDVDWRRHWYYGWDEIDSMRWGSIAYPVPSSYEVRRFYLGSQPVGPHTDVDAFTVYENRFRRSYQYGYYDLLLWSNIDSKDGTQVLKINEQDVDAVQATTTVTRGMTRLKTDANSSSGSSSIVGLYNQPEIFYSGTSRGVYISGNTEDYDYFDSELGCWVKHINCKLYPVVYLYLVQVIFVNNDGRVVGASGNAALSAFASSTNVNTCHTNDDPAMVFFNTRYKENQYYGVQTADIIGGKFTTFGLCDMSSYAEVPDHQYIGSRMDLPNYLMVDVLFRNGVEKTMQYEVTEQCRKQAHGGIITVVVDCGDLEIPDPPHEEGTGSLFVPTVEDYDEVVFEIPLGS